MSQKSVSGVVRHIILSHYTKEVARGAVCSAASRGATSIDPADVSTAVDVLFSEAWATSAQSVLLLDGDGFIHRDHFHELFREEVLTAHLAALKLAYDSRMGASVEDEIRPKSASHITRRIAANYVCREKSSAQSATDPQNIIEQDGSLFLVDFSAPSGVGATGPFGVADMLLSLPHDTTPEVSALQARSEEIFSLWNNSETRDHSASVEELVRFEYEYDVAYRKLCTLTNGALQPFGKIDREAGLVSLLSPTTAASAHAAAFVLSRVVNFFVLSRDSSLHREPIPRTGTTARAEYSVPVHVNMTDCTYSLARMSGLTFLEYLSAHA